MAIDLFANFERSRNSKLFYRTVAFGSYPIFLRLVDLDNPSENYTGRYTARFSINNGPSSQFPMTPGGHFEKNLLFDSSSPSLCSIKVELKNAVNNTTINTFELQCRFVTSLEPANFILWPKYLVQNVGGTITSTVLNALNYNLATNTLFYGEGHTETFYLSCWNITVGLNSMWFVGNRSVDLINKARSGLGLNQADSILSVTPGGFLNSGIVDVVTKPSQKEEIPVSLFVYDNTIITPTSPIITYNDSTGDPEYYPFFYSTQDPFGNPNPQNNSLRNDIRVLPYEDPLPITLSSELSTNSVFLPLDYSFRSFDSYLTIPPQPTTPVVENYVGSSWNVTARSFGGNWGDETDSITNTGLLPSLTSYSLSLKYDNLNNGILDYFTTAEKYQTSITVYCSAYRDLSINVAPFDWLPRTVVDKASQSTIVYPLPFGNKIFTPNYYNEKNQTVRFELIVNYKQTQYRIQSVTYSSDQAYSSYTTYNSPFVGNLSFKKAGLASINVIINVVNTKTNDTQIFSAYFPNMIEVVESFDEINEDYYYADASSTLINNAAPPYLTPNEWVTTNAMNFVVDRFYDLLEETERFSFKYENASCFYGWLGIDFSQSLTWEDAECPPANENTVSWKSFECIECITPTPTPEPTHVAPIPTPTPQPTSPPPSCPGRDDVLNRFTLQGEGGYAWNTFNFVDKDKIYVSQRYADAYYNEVLGSYRTTYAYTTAIGGTTYYGLSNAVRFCAGNKNNSAIFRDGYVFTNGTRYLHTWLQANLNDMKDLFMPSNYATNYVQAVLMKNGELRKLDLNDTAEFANPPLVQGSDETTSPASTKTLNNVVEIMTINQAHNSDMIVACSDDTVWHVAISNGNSTIASDISARRIKDLKASEVAFIMLGDPGDSCFVVLKSDRKKIYRLTYNGTVLSRNLGSFSWINGRDTTPVNLNPFTYDSGQPPIANFLESDEYFVSGMSNEFHFVLLTNKYVHCFKAAQGGSYGTDSGKGYKKHALSAAQLPALRVATATSYAMVVMLADGFYLLSSGENSTTLSTYDSSAGSGSEYNKSYQNMVKLENWTNLEAILRPLRSDGGASSPFNPACAPEYTYS